MPLEEILSTFFSQDPALDEILFDGSHTVSLVAGDRRHLQLMRHASEELWMDALQDFALSQGVRWDPLHPSAGGVFSLPIGGREEYFRWHGLLPPIARDGVLLSVRRHRLGSFRLTDFMDPSQAAALLSLLADDSPVLILGPTGAGKTSLMLTLLLQLYKDERVALIEQLPEIPRLSPHWLRLCARSSGLSGEGVFTLDRIVDELLRLRPDRIVIGELRREESSAFKRALLVGHKALWTSLHASGPEQVCDRLAEMSGTNAGEWQRLLSQRACKMIWLQRQTPRFQGVWQLAADSCSKLISCV